MLTIIKSLFPLLLTITVVLNSTELRAASIKKHKKTLIRQSNSSTLSLDTQSGLATLQRGNSKKLTLVPHSKNLSRFYYTTALANRDYEIAGVINNSSGKIEKIGFLSYKQKVRNNSDACSFKKTNTDLLKQIADISSENSYDVIYEKIDSSCSKNLNKNDYKKLVTSYDDLLSYGSNSLILECANNNTAREHINKEQHLATNLNSILTSIYSEKQKISSGEMALKIFCEEQTSPAFSAKFDETGNERKIVIPYSKKEKSISSGNCSNLRVNLAHEFSHYSGIKNEVEINSLISTCMQFSGEQSSDKDSKKCVDPKEKKELDKFKIQGIGAGTKSMAMVEAINESKEEIASKDRQNIQKHLENNVSNTKVETISKKESIELAKLADNSKYTDYNEAPKAEAQKIEQKLEPIAVKMEQNLANVSKSVDSALGIASETAYAESNDSSELASSSRGSYTTSNYAGTSSSSSGSDSSFSKREAGSANIRTTSNRNPASFSKLKMNGNAQEYVVEEILADKYGLSKSEVQKISNDIRSRNSRGNAPSANLAGNNSNEVSSSSAGSGAPESPAIGAAGGSSGIGSLGGGVNTQRTAARPRGNNTGGSSARSPSSTASPVSGDEVVGLDYRNVKTRYRDQEFVNEITNSNIRILIPSLKKRIGSTEKDATIYVDTGTSLLRKK